MGVVSRMTVTRIPALLMARMADSRPPPGPLTRTSHCCIPASLALFAASYAACCAANGVPLREPRKPRAPEEDCAIRFPSVSVIEISVLLNDAAMWTMPTGMFFFSFLRKVFFFPAVGVVAFAMIQAVSIQWSALSPFRLADRYLKSQTHAIKHKLNADG